MDLTQPLVLTNTQEMFDVDAKVKGGGFQGQTGAIRLGITRALLDYDKTTPADSDNSFRKVLKAAAFILFLGYVGIDTAGIGSRGRKKTGATYFWSSVVEAQGSKAMEKVTQAIYRAIEAINGR